MPSAPRRFAATRLLAAVYACAGPLVACTPFATVRSAAVRPGPSVALHASASTRLEDNAAWFWSADCASACGHSVVGGDLGFTYGWPPADGATAFALGAGLSGVYPYVDGYVQLARGPRPFGLGARVGVPLTSWSEHQVYARYDIPLTPTARVLLNPALFLHEGRAPNGESPGQFLGIVQGVGLEFEGEYVSWTPAVAVIAGRAERNSYGRQYGPVSSVFATASLGVTWHRRSEAAAR